MFVYMLMCDGFEESEAVVTADILARGGVEVRFVSPYGKFKAVGSHGFVIASRTVKSTTHVSATQTLLFSPAAR